MRDRTTETYDVVFYLPTITPLLTQERVLPAGGAETQIFLLTRALAGAGVRVCLVAGVEEGVEVPASVDGIDVVVRPHYRAHQRLIGKVREAARIRRTLDGVDARCVVGRVAGVQVGLVGLFTRLRGRRFVYSSANIADFDVVRLVPNRRDQALFRLGVRLANRIVVQTEEQVLACNEQFGKPARLIKSIAEQADRRDAAPESFLWIGRVVWYKRPLAYVELAKALPDARFQMVAVPHPGSPAQMELMRELEEAARDVPNLEILAPRPRHELMELVERAVAVVNTADFEGMPNIFLEGWARGVPALCLSHDPDGVIGRYGLGRFAAGSPERLAEGARELWDGRGADLELEERCRGYVADHHSLDVVVAQWLAVLGLPQPAAPAVASETRVPAGVA